MSEDTNKQGTAAQLLIDQITTYLSNCVRALLIDYHAQLAALVAAPAQLKEEHARCEKELQEEIIRQSEYIRDHTTLAIRDTLEMAKATCRKVVQECDGWPRLNDYLKALDGIAPAEVIRAGEARDAAIRAEGALANHEEECGVCHCVSTETHQRMGPCKRARKMRADLDALRSASVKPVAQASEDNDAASKQ